MNRKLLTPIDICIIILIVLICFVVMFFHLFSDDGRTAVVSVNDDIIAEFELDTNREKLIKTDEGYNVVVIKNKECFVLKADCRDGICVKHQPISKVGQSIVCLPHKLIVEIK